MHERHSINGHTAFHTGLFPAGSNGCLSATRRFSIDCWNRVGRWTLKIQFYLLFPLAFAALAKPNSVRALLLLLLAGSAWFFGGGHCLATYRRFFLCGSTTPGWDGMRFPLYLVHRVTLGP